MGMQAKPAVSSEVPGNSEITCFECAECRKKSEFDIARSLGNLCPSGSSVKSESLDAIHLQCLLNKTHVKEAASFLNTVPVSLNGFFTVRKIHDAD